MELKVRVFAISDIHGYNKDFQNLLNKISLEKTDILFLLGDFIDRGPESKEVLDTIFFLLESGHDIRCIRGNHEQMLLDGLTNHEIRIKWLKNGGDETLGSFLTSSTNRIHSKYIEFLNSLPFSLTFENFIFVHAGLNMSIEDPFSDVKSLLWLREWQSQFNSQWLGNRRIIHGHTPMKTSFLFSNENLQSPVINIDNGIYLKGQKEYGNLYAIDLNNMTLISS